MSSAAVWLQGISLRSRSSTMQNAAFIDCSHTRLLRLEASSNLMTGKFSGSKKVGHADLGPKPVLTEALSWVSTPDGRAYLRTWPAVLTRAIVG